MGYPVIELLYGYHFIFRGIKDGAKGPGRNLEHGLPPPDTVEPYTIAVDDQQPTAGDLNMQTRVNIY